MTEDKSIITLNELAYDAIAKHSHQIFKYETELADLCWKTCHQ